MAYDYDEDYEDEEPTGSWRDDPEAQAEDRMTADYAADLTAPGIYDREPDEPGMDYGPDEDDW